MDQFSITSSPLLCAERMGRCYVTPGVDGRWEESQMNKIPGLYNCKYT